MAGLAEGVPLGDTLDVGLGEDVLLGDTLDVGLGEEVLLGDTLDVGLGEDVLAGDTLENGLGHAVGAGLVRVCEGARPGVGRAGRLGPAIADVATLVTPGVGDAQLGSAV